MDFAKRVIAVTQDGSLSKRCITVLSRSDRDLNVQGKGPPLHEMSNAVAAAVISNARSNSMHPQKP